MISTVFPSNYTTCMTTEYLRLCTIGKPLAFGFKMLIPTEDDVELSVDIIVIEACGRPVNNNTTFLGLFKTRQILSRDDFV